MAERVDPELARQLSPDELIEVLKECVREVFISVIFSFESGQGRGSELEHVPAALPADSASLDYGVEVSFHGLVQGAVLLRAARSAAESIARSMLALEPDEELLEDELRDALGECVNLVAGGLKSRALDPLGTFGLGTPEAFVPAGQQRTNAPTRTQIYKLSRSQFSMEIWTDAA